MYVPGTYSYTKIIFFTTFVCMSVPANPGNGWTDFHWQISDVIRSDVGFIIYASFEPWHYPRLLSIASFKHKPTRTF